MSTPTFDITSYCAFCGGNHVPLEPCPGVESAKIQRSSGVDFHKLNCDNFGRVHHWHPMKLRCLDDPTEEFEIKRCCRCLLERQFA